MKAQLKQKILFLMAVLFFVFFPVFAEALEPPAIEWERTFGGIGGDYGYSVQQTSNGEYIVAGETNSFGAGESDVYLIKTDALGNIGWEKTFGGSRLDEARSIQQTSDNGYIMTGFTTSFQSGPHAGWHSDIYLIKTNASGTLQWQKIFGRVYDDHGYIISEDAYSVQQTSDGGYIVAGCEGTWYIYLIKTDSSGNLRWQKTFTGVLGAVAYSVQQTTDSGYIVVGHTKTRPLGEDFDVYLIKTDSSGNLRWERTFGGTNSDGGHSIQQTADGGYIIAGNTRSFGARGSDVYLIKTDANGNPQWQKTFGGVNDDYGVSVQQTTDGGYIIAGRTDSSGAGGYDIYLIKTDAFGNQQWEETIGGVNDDCGYSVQQTTDGGYIVAGYTNSFGAGNSDVYLIKFAPETSTPTVPVIVLPGILGSWSEALRHGIPDFNSPDWQLVDYFFPDIVIGDYYKSFINSLASSGFTVAPCPYDWRLSIPDAVQYFLIPKIDEVKRFTGASQVDIVAHSLGGLVSRYYIQSNQYRDDIRKVILVGVPNHGAAGAYFPWEGGVVPPSFNPVLKILFQEIIWFHMLNNYGSSPMQTVRAYFPSIQWLLPTYDYLKNFFTGEVIPESDMQERNLWLPILNSWPTMTSKGVQPYQIIGTGNNKTSLFLKVAPSILFWPDGKPWDVEKTNEGDKTVLVSSAQLGEVAPIATSFTVATDRFEHANLLAKDEVTTAIKNFLSPSPRVMMLTKEICQESPTTITSALSFCAFNNIDILVTDPSGKHSGWNNVSNNTLLEIPNSWYSGRGRNQMVLVINPTVGKYTVTLSSDVPTTAIVAGFYADETTIDVSQAETLKIDISPQRNLPIDFLLQGNLRVLTTAVSPQIWNYYK